MPSSEQAMRWDNRLNPQGKAIVEARRSRYVRGYDNLYQQGYYVVGEVSPYSGRLLRQGSRARVTMIQELVAREEIERLEEVDGLRNRRRAYTWAEGAVFPIKQSLHPQRIRLPEHVRAYKHGITIFAREDTLKDISVDSEIEELIASVFPRDQQFQLISNVLQ